MARKKYIAKNKEQLIQEIDRRTEEGEKVKTIAFALGLHAGIVQEFVHLTKLKNKREQEALQIEPPEYLNCFGDYFNKLNDERYKRDT
ncbi:MULTISPECIES: hypothetical protein [Bacillus cereus group]|jgi:hypothetical protein|uniref:hypothetical protein n=1 Tax=Bacillus cereus group TaxID=86661 RepID=UPI001F48B0E5|nr:hypothetical protein [Bacillus cereus]MDA1521494.1 hypothetical protein [Bacillus cereus]BCC09530.1 hypothetical protein BCM0060_p2196 [Bacillus cereus]BCC16519.1 hypothetical protein BCM0075_1289 [Bacillus cereus]BCC50574.1 hypothetical protein BCJMU02_p2168 [Bacillus cereus]BCD08963.1 hypothetical protein BC30052_p2245 [Bacillus cereus]